ncbi:DUF305 domain-containing protein [Alcaligenaceae bacterium]|nr:DUF305 domain-containing protein [Alcaligenaceae bacterium]
MPLGFESLPEVQRARVRELADQIIESQRRESKEMKALINDLDK